MHHLLMKLHPIISVGLQSSCAGFILVVRFILILLTVDLEMLFPGTHCLVNSCPEPKNCLVFVHPANYLHIYSLKPQLRTREDMKS